MNDSTAINRANWDERAPAHATSASYGVARFTEDPAHLSDVVRFDRPRLGDLSGVRGVHLQCHIGTDTVSLSRLGARMSGLDFSPPALAEARRLAEATGADIDFHESDVHDALDVLPAGGFDLVYTGIGALCWLPSATRWAAVVSALLRPGGRLFIREAHPMLLAFDERTDPLALAFPYFEHEAPVVFEEQGTYVETEATFTHTVTHTWNHGLAEVVTALLDNGLRLTALTEHNSIPWQAIPTLMTQSPHDNEWRLTTDPDRLAASYTIEATKS